MTPFEERFKTLRRFADDEVDELSAEWLYVMRDGFALLTVFHKKLNRDRLFVRMIVIPCVAVDARKQIPYELAFHPLIQHRADQRLPVRGHTPEVWQRCIHPQAIVRNQVVGTQ